MRPAKALFAARDSLSEIQKNWINSSRFIHFYTYSIFSQRYLSNSRSAILVTARYLVLLVTQQNYYFFICDCFISELYCKSNYIIFLSFVLFTAFFYL